MIHIDGIRRQVYIRFIDLSSVHDILHATNGETVYKHVTDEISPVRLMEAGMGSKRVRLANLPPKVSNNNIRCCYVALWERSNHTGRNLGEALSLQCVYWSKKYYDTNQTHSVLRSH